MNKLTKTKELTNMTKNDNFQGSLENYGDQIDNHPFEARDEIFEDPNPVAVTNEQKLIKQHRLLNIKIHTNLTTYKLKFITQQ